ncbi:transcriptional regulator [Zhengella mangrovi]|uniref:Shikimate kinase n=1 Tax=Zhengella mangrovi TaxID=1982044 RepID=A0A2G1QQ37_9HYPH|nr:helix-turn-helix transcriptional regulator [Zhengella mangrovi]PHP67667.1 transcriptional regulator [Zhengella mangrovi]
MLKQASAATGPDDEDSETGEFIAMVGERVRMARNRKGISRRQLSELSGVSQRYLAQLEGGDGNVSIALLRKIARSLDFEIEWLVGRDDPWTSDAITLMRLFRQATRDQRARVMEILDPNDTGTRRSGRVALIGLRGAGKSTLGRLAARDLGVAFVELNQVIEEVAGMPVDEVIALYGQEGYRRLEKQALVNLVATHEQLVLAVAGGIVSEPDTYNYLLRHCHTIWLKAQPEEHMNRVRGQGDERPMAGNPAAMDELKSILTSREALYAKAEAMVDTSRKDVDESRLAVIEAIRDNAFLPL